MDRGIFVVGLGGTGGLLVPKLAKIINGIPNVALWLMDGDIVDEGNIARQPYQKFNVNEKKATSLTRKTTSNYELKVYEHSDYIMGIEIANICENECYEEVFILGCVDNHSTRMLLEQNFMEIEGCVYIDAANGLNDGSVFIAQNLKGKIKGTLRSSLFREMKTATDHPTGTCEASINKGNFQQFVTNDIMANSIAMVLSEFLSNCGEVGVIKVEGFERIFVTEK